MTNIENGDPHGRIDLANSPQPEVFRAFLESFVSILPSPHRGRGQGEGDIKDKTFEKSYRVRAGGVA